MLRWADLFSKHANLPASPSKIWVTESMCSRKERVSSDSATLTSHGSAQWLYDSPLLRARSCREPYQTAQDSACLRSHLIPIGARQSGPLCPAHRHLLADAWRPRRQSPPRDLANAEFSTLRLRLLNIERLLDTSRKISAAHVTFRPAVVSWLSQCRYRRR